MIDMCKNMCDKAFKIFLSRLKLDVANFKALITRGQVLDKIAWSKLFVGILPDDLGQPLEALVEVCWVGDGKGGPDVRRVPAEWLEGLSWQGHHLLFGGLVHDQIPRVIQVLHLHPQEHAATGHRPLAQACERKVQGCLDLVDSDLVDCRDLVDHFCCCSGNKNGQIIPWE